MPTFCFHPVSFPVPPSSISVTHTWMDESKARFLGNNHQTIRGRGHAGAIPPSSTGAVTAMVLPLSSLGGNSTAGSRLNQGINWSVSSEIRDVQSNYWRRSRCGPIATPCYIARQLIWTAVTFSERNPMQRSDLLGGRSGVDNTSPDETLFAADTVLFAPLATTLVPRPGGAGWLHAP